MIIQNIKRIKYTKIAVEQFFYIIFIMSNLIEIKMRDNIILRGLIYLSKNNLNDNNKCMVILSISPYRNFEQKESIEIFGKFLSTIPAHYIVMDVRGTGESDGIDTNEYSQDEILDTMDCIKYIYMQDWCNMSIMMHGMSYSAFNALQSLENIIKPNALFIMHVSNDRFNNDVHYFGGVKTITEDMNYSYAMTSSNIQPCKLCNNISRYNYTPHYMKWFEQSNKNNKAWLNGLIMNNNLPPIFLICGWRDSYSSSAVKLSNISTFTLIGPFGHNYPKNHNMILKEWINILYQNKWCSKLHYCMVIPTPKSLWKLGYYNIKPFNKDTAIYKTIDINNNITLIPDMVGETLEIYISGDMVTEPTIERVRNDLRRNQCGYEYIININDCVWGFPILTFECVYTKGDYIVARLTTDTGETLSIGVIKLIDGINILEMRPFFVPNNIKMHLFLNRSWIPVLFPTTNMDNINIINIQLKLPIITEYEILYIYPPEDDTALLKDIISTIEYKDNTIIYNANINYDNFKENLNATFTFGKGTTVIVNDNYNNISTTTTIISNKTDTFDVKIKAYNNMDFIKEWYGKYII